MKVFKNHHNCEDPINFLGFEDLAAEGLGKDCLFFYGGHPNPKIYEASDKPKYFFTTEEQSWDADSTDNCIKQVEKILTICPPSATGRAKRELVFFPFNEKFIPTVTEKRYDVIYTGTATGPHVSYIVDIISKFPNYRFVSFGNDQRITNHHVSYTEKLKLISESKIDVIHNLTGVGTPQMKTRMVEAAFCRSLILCRRDEWNIIESFLTPGVDFIYYDSNTLEDLLTLILSNYSSFQGMIDSAYDKAINNFTTRHFVQKYLS